MWQFGQTCYDNVSVLFFIRFNNAKLFNRILTTWRTSTASWVLSNVSSDADDFNDEKSSLYRHGWYRDFEPRRTSRIARYLKKSNYRYLGIPFKYMVCRIFTQLPSLAVSGQQRWFSSHLPKRHLRLIGNRIYCDPPVIRSLSFRCDAFLTPTREYQ